MSWLFANWETLAVAVLAAVGGLWTLAKAIAPLTETTVDDKLAGALGKVHGLLKRVLGLA